MASQPRHTADEYRRAKEEIAERRRDVEANHTVVQGEVVHPNGRTTK